jgi:uncharacterized lipoprotein YmbA
VNARARCAAAAAAALTACGYSFGSGMERRGVRTVALDVVGNDTFRQRLEAELSSRLSRELPVSSDLVLADHASADAVLQVVLTAVDERTLVTGQRSDPVREGAFIAAVWVRLVDRNGKVVLERRIQDRTEFRSPIGEDLTTARAELVEDLARKIALSLEADL